MAIIDTSLQTPNPGPFPGNRRCTHTDRNGVRCITRLHRYHFGDRCYTHEPEMISLPNLVLVAPMNEAA